MQYIKQQIDQGNVELARFNGNNKAIPMEYSELSEKRDMLNKRGLIVQKLKTLSQDQKHQWINFKRLRGNQLYKSQKWTQASETYLESLLGLDVSGKDGDYITKTNFELKYPILLNIATCLYKKKEFKAAVEVCNKILEEADGKKFTKAYYKKACILLANNNYQQAKKAASQGMKCLLRENILIKNSGKQIGKADFIKLFNELDMKMSNEKSLYTKMFKKEDEEQQQSQKLIEDQAQNDILVYNDTLWDRITFCCRTTYRRLRSTLPIIGKGKQM